MLCVGWAEPYNSTAALLSLAALTHVSGGSTVSFTHSETSSESSLKQRNVLFSRLQLFEIFSLKFLFFNFQGLHEMFSLFCL